MRLIRFFISLFNLVFLLAMVGCGDEDGPSGPIANVQDVVSEGWDYFIEAEYQNAFDTFTRAIEMDRHHSDAHNGAGWSSGKIPGMLEQASDYFARSYSLDTTRYDALGGWSFVVYQLGEWEATIAKADSLLRRRPVWQFLHESNIDFHDVWLIVASSNCHLGHFERALEIIKDYLNSSFDADSSTPAGRREILDEIERLGRIYG